MSNLAPETIASINQNWEVMVNNFGKISGWLIQGSDSPNPMPPAVAKFLADYEAQAKTIAAQEKIIKGLGNALANTEKASADAVKAHTAMTDTLQEYIDEMAELRSLVESSNDDDSDSDSELELELEPKKVVKTAKKATKKVSPPTKSVADEQLEVTAAAIDAGDISEEAVAELNSIADTLRGGAAAVAAL